MNPEICSFVRAEIKGRPSHLISPCDVDPMVAHVFRGLSTLVNDHSELITRDILVRLERKHDSILEALIGKDRAERILIKTDPATRVELGYAPPFGYEANQAYLAFMNFLWKRFLETWLRIQEQGRFPLPKGPEV